jgi:hypothetical protein
VTDCQNEAVSIDNHVKRDSARTPVFMLVQTSAGALWAFDVGMGGLRVFSRKMLNIGQYLDVSFRLPDEDTEHKVGAQVASFQSWPQGGLAVRLRFCRPSKSLQLALYRLLDRRRAMWDAEVIHHVAEAPAPVDLDARPFEGMLLEAFAALRLKELNRPGFSRRGPSLDLENLSRLLGRDTSDAATNAEVAGVDEVDEVAA